jgi:glycosyltransferase involved in cell wall biosynthesis
MPDLKNSVLMGAYNAESTVGTAIESILGQTWTNLELIVVDDGSGDRTWNTIQSFVGRDSRVIALRHGNNRGAYAARNTALSVASGALLTVQDADDWSHPQRLRLQVDSLLQHGQLLNSTDLARVDLQFPSLLARGPAPFASSARIRRGRRVSS